MTQVERVFTASIGGKVFCGLIHITVLNWLVWYENFLLKFICFIFHQESAILGRIRLPHAGFLFYLFQDESLFSKVSIGLLDITACCVNAVQVQGHQVKPLGRVTQLPSGMIPTSTWGILLAGPFSCLPPPTVMADPFRNPPPHIQKQNLIIYYSFYSK